MGNTTVISVPGFTSTSTAFSFPSLTPPSSSPPSSTFIQQQSSSSQPQPNTPPTSTSAPLPTATIPESPASTELLVLVTPSSNDPNPSTYFITRTQSIAPLPTASTPRSSATQPSSSISSNAAALATPSANPSASSGGMSPGGKIAVAVVVPVAAVALIVLAALFFWRKRKQRKDGEELRRKEVEEYGFNPNDDPTLPAIGVASSNEDGPSNMKEKDGAGYRGWGTTTNPRKPSGTLSTGNGPIGIARSDSGSNPGGYPAGSPTGGAAHNSDVQSGDPLVSSPTHARPGTADSETIGALGSAPAALGNRQDRDIHRGPSNASSAYSGGHRSDSSENGLSGTTSGQHYYNDGLYFDDGMPQHGPYGDGSYSGGQPVIRDVQARRNTRIENPTVFPQQANAGIAQNF